MSASPEPRPIRSETDATNETVDVAASAAAASTANIAPPQPFYPLPTTQLNFVPTSIPVQTKYTLAGYQSFPPYYPVYPLQISQEALDESLVTIVMIDMLIRGGNDAEEQYRRLAEAYPRASAIAQNYTDRAYNQPLPLSSVPNGSELLFGDTEQNFIVDRIRVASVAWFSFMIGSLVATLRIWIVILLAIVAALGKSTDNTIIYELAKEVTDATLRDNPRRQLYQWIFEMLNDNAGLNELNIDAAAVLMGPIVMGCIGFFIGIVVGVMVNMALRMIGGIRVRTRRPHQD